MKSEFLDRRLRLNGAAYYYDYKDYQALIYTVSLEQLIVNADATHKGAELELEWAPSEAWRFGAGVLGGLIAVAGLTNRANANPNPNACRHRCYNRCRKVPPADFQTCYGACLTACLGG